MPKEWPPPTPPGAVFPGGLYDAIAALERGSLAQARPARRSSPWPRGLAPFVVGVALLFFRKYWG